MQFIEVLVIALALSLDSAAVALAASGSGLIQGQRATFRLSFHFGLFQFLMPVLGWALGATIEPSIAAFDHWVAFILLAFVGARMVKAALTRTSENQMGDPSHGVVLIMLAIATSIDAMAVGLSIAMVRMTVWYPSVMIGAVTAGMTILAVLLGNRLGASMAKRAQFAGGIVLFLIGMRIVISHLN